MKIENIFKNLTILLVFGLLISKINAGVVKPAPANPNALVLGFMSPYFDPEYIQYSGAAEYAISQYNETFKTKYGKTITLYKFEDGNDIIDSLNLVTMPVNGIVGPAYSGTSSTACLVFGAFSVPSISFYATGASLSNSGSYPFFQRVMPDDRLQVRAIISLLKKNGWSRVSCVHTNEDYGNGGADQLVQQSNAQGITVNTNQAINPIDSTYTPPQSDYDIVFDNLIAAKARVIVLYALFPPDCLSIWNQAKKRGFLGEGFTWIVTDGCAELTGGNDEDLAGILATFPSYGLGTQKYANFEKTIVTDYNNHSGDAFYKGASFSYDATIAMLMGIEAVLANGGDPWDGEQVKTQLRSLKFQGITGTVAFDKETGDRLYGEFALLNLINSTKGSFDPIGSINPESGDIALSRDILYSGPTFKVPSDYQVIVFDRTLNIVLGVITGICVLIVIGIGLVIVLQWRKFRYSSPLFCMFIIIGALMGLASVFTLLPTPTTPLCSSFPWLLGLGYVIVFGTLFTKTWRTWRLFSNARKFKIIRISNQYIITLVGAFVLLESIFMILWTAIDRQLPLAVPIFKAGEAQLQCTSDSEAWWYVFVFYKVFYILFGVFLAFKTRNVVDSLNESKPITLALYNLTFVMVVAIALGFILRDNPIAIIVIQTIAILLGFTVTVSVLFLPKVWMIISGQQHSMDSIGTSMDSMGRSNGNTTEAESTRGYTNKDYNNQSVGRSFSAHATGFKDVAPSNHPQLGIVYTGGDSFPRVGSQTAASRSEAEINVSQDVLAKANKKNESNESSSTPSENNI
ncbi:hypothetical protein RB653_005035 [Dictyostelium firmibasis]|uniref:G-protein coupled receptors family 3 profile domain-containing protein n=1 Tax=Dictyostelium firmibasis TaxID=79012 RepID=A0AAN7YXU0_9MYCE